MNKCLKCKSKENLMRYDSKRNTFMCRNCNTNKKNKYRKGINGVASTKRAKVSHRKMNPVKCRARKKLQKAIANHKIIKPMQCVCGSTRDIQGHHADYTKPLDVIWVCRSCHTSIHKTCNTNKTVI